MDSINFGNSALYLLSRSHSVSESRCDSLSDKNGQGHIDDKGQGTWMSSATVNRSNWLIRHIKPMHTRYIIWELA